MRIPEPRKDVRWTDLLPETLTFSEAGLTLAGGYLFSLWVASWPLKGVDWVAQALGSPTPAPVHKALLLWLAAVLEIWVVAVLVVWDAPKRAEHRRREEARAVAIREMYLRSRAEQAREREAGGSDAKSPSGDKRGSARGDPTMRGSADATRSAKANVPVSTKRAVANSANGDATISANTDEATSADREATFSAGTDEATSSDREATTSADTDASNTEDTSGNDPSAEDAAVTPAPPRPARPSPPSYGCVIYLPDDEANPPAGPKSPDGSGGPGGFTVIRLQRQKEEPPDPQPLPPGLTEAQWYAIPSATALLSHALPRIPVRHACLVLSQLIEPAWRGWSLSSPEEWRPGFCLTVLRAWCFGEATLAELDAARGELRHMLEAPEVGLGQTPLERIVVEAVLGASVHAGFHREAAVSDEAGRLVMGALARVLQVRDTRGFEQGLAAIELERANRSLTRRGSSQLAEWIRRWVPYPRRLLTGWSRRGDSTVFAGDAILTLDGWHILEARPQGLRPPRLSRN